MLPNVDGKASCLEDTLWSGFLSKSTKTSGHFHCRIWRQKPKKERAIIVKMAKQFPFHDLHYQSILHNKICSQRKKRAVLKKKREPTGWSSWSHRRGSSGRTLARSYARLDGKTDLCSQRKPFAFWPLTRNNRCGFSNHLWCISKSNNNETSKQIPDPAEAQCVMTTQIH